MMFRRPCRTCGGRGLIDLLLTDESIPCPSCTAAGRIIEHTGNLDYLAPAVRARGDVSPPASATRARSGRATVDVATALTTSTESPQVATTIVPGPGRPSLSLAQLRESARIQLMIASHRFKAAERERLDDLAHAQEWLS